MLIASRVENDVDKPNKKKIKFNNWLFEKDYIEPWQVFRCLNGLSLLTTYYQN